MFTALANGRRVCRRHQTHGIGVLQFALVGLRVSGSHHHRRICDIRDCSYRNMKCEIAREKQCQEQLYLGDIHTK